jgi:hypothetical protein
MADEIARSTSSSPAKRDGIKAFDAVMATMNSPKLFLSHRQA